MWASYVKTEATKSFIFLPPMVGTNKHYSINDSLNVYHKDEDRPDLRRHIFILFEKSKDFNYEDRRSKSMTSNPYFLESYSPKEDLIMYVYSVPDEFIEDYYIFLTSKYSKLSDLCKKTVLKYHGFGPTDLLHKNLYLTADRKKQLEEDLNVYLPDDAEYMSLLNPEVEIFSTVKLESLKQQKEKNREEEGDLTPM